MGIGQLLLAIRNRWPPTRSFGDDVELVALDVSKSRPPCVRVLDVAKLLGPEVHKSLRFGEKAVAHEVEMKAVLDDLRLGHAVERQAGSAAGLVVGEKNSIFGGGAICDLSAEDGTPEMGQCISVGAVNGDPKKGIAHGVPSRNNSGFGAVQPPDQTAVRPPSAAMTAPV